MKKLKLDLTDLVVESHELLASQVPRQEGTVFGRATGECTSIDGCQETETNYLTREAECIGETQDCPITESSPGCLPTNWTYCETNGPEYTCWLCNSECDPCE